MANERTRHDVSTAPAAGHRIDIERAQWPLIRVYFRGAITPEILHGALERYAALAEEAHARGERLSWLINLDAFDLSINDAIRRKLAAELLDRYGARIAPGTLAEARVASSFLMRGPMTAMAWLVRQRWPLEIFPTEAEAVAWLQSLRRPR